MLKYGVLGSGIGYTLSPKIHSIVFDKLGVNASYDVIDLPTDGLPSEIKRLKNEYDGFNVTKPFKTEIIKHLDEVKCSLGAVNTVRRENGTFVGYNTDVKGFYLSLTRMTGEIKGQSTLVLGAGGASEAVISALVTAGADVSVNNRTTVKAVALAEKYRIKVWNGEKPTVIINATSLGLDGISNPLPNGVDTSECKYAYDLIYKPSETPFMTFCKKAGAKVSNGLGMLVYQAILADEIFIGQSLDVDGLYEEIMKIIVE